VVLVALKAKGFWSVIPFLAAIVVGYLVAWPLGLVNPILVLEGVKLFVVPNFAFIGTYALD